MTAADLRLFRYALAIARAGGFGRAAKALGIAQPPLSQQIARLEAELDVTLFVRHRGGATPTAAGRVFLDRAAAAVREAEAAVDAGRRAGRGEAGVLTMGLTGGTMFGFLPRVLSAFRQRYPGVTLDLRNLDAEAQVAALGSGDIDLGFTRAVAHGEDVHLRRIATEAWIAALPSAHPRARAHKVRLAELAKDPFVLFPPSASGFHGEVVTLCRNAGFLPRMTQAIAPMHAVVGLVGAGLGVSVVPASVRCMRLPGVRYVGLAGLERASHLYLASSRTRQPPVAATFAAFVQEHAQRRESGH